MSTQGTDTPLSNGVRRFAPLLAILLLAVIAMLIGFRLGSRPLPRPARRLQVTVLNVGSGESAWIRTPGGQVILIGAGPPEAAERVAGALEAQGVREIDLLVLPYAAEGAIGGAPALINRIPVRTVLESGATPVSSTMEEIRALLQAKEIPTQIGRAAGKMDLGGVMIEVLAPADPLPRGEATAGVNSLVLRVSYGDSSFLFAGGLEAAGEEALLERAPNMAAEWLRVAHLGTRTGTSSELLRRVRPSIAVLSVAPGNSGGYPHRETLERLEAAGVRLYRTDQQQTPLSFWSDGSRITRN